MPEPGSVHDPWRRGLDLTHATETRVDLVVRRSRRSRPRRRVVAEPVQVERIGPADHQPAARAHELEQRRVVVSVSVCGSITNTVPVGSRFASTTGPRCARRRDARSGRGAPRRREAVALGAVRRAGDAARLAAADRAVDPPGEQVERDEPRRSRPTTMVPKRRALRLEATCVAGALAVCVLISSAVRSLARARDDARPLAARGVEIGWHRVAAAVRDRLERARQLVERLGAERTAHLVGRDRRPVADRAAVAEAEQPGAEAEPERVRRGRRRARRRRRSVRARPGPRTPRPRPHGSRCRASGLPRRARTLLTTNAIAPPTATASRWRAAAIARNVREHAAEPVDDAVQTIAEPAQRLAERSRCGRRSGTGGPRECGAPRPRCVGIDGS